MHEQQTLEQGASVEDRLIRTCAVEPGGQIRFETERGAVEVQTTDAQTFTLELIRTTDEHQDRPPLDEMVQVTVESNGAEITAQAKFFSRWQEWWRGLSRARLRFILTVPSRCDVHLRTAGGGILVPDLNGAVNCRTSGGSISLGRIQGTVIANTSGGGIDLEEGAELVELKTSGGSVRIGGVDGELAASTSGGSISVARVLGRAFVHTSGGSITVGDAKNAVEAITSGGHVTVNLARQPRETCRLETSGGHVTVFLPEECAVTLNARTSGGQVTSEFTVPYDDDRRKTSIRAPLNGGGTELMLRTAGGNIHIRKRTQEREARPQDNL